MCHKVQKDIFLSPHSLQIAFADAFYYGLPSYFTKFM